MKNAELDEFLEAAICEAPLDYQGKWTCHLVRRLSARGFTESDLAEVMNISLKTLEEWKLAHDELVEALRRGREEANCAVEASLIQLALGYEYPEEVILRSGRKVTFTRYQPPDLEAIEYYLENNMPEVYIREPSDARLCGGASRRQLCANWRHKQVSCSIELYVL